MTDPPYDTPPRPAATNVRPLAVMLPRQPGSREARYMHLLGGPIDTTVRVTSFEQPRQSETTARLEVLEAEVASLRAAVTQLEARLTAE